MPTPPIPAAPPGPGGADAATSRGAPDPPGTPFERVLDQHDQAWTADAGGQQNGPASDSPSEGQQQPADPAALLAALVAGPLPIAAATPPSTTGGVGGDGSQAVPIVASATPAVIVPVTVAVDAVPAPPTAVATTPAGATAVAAAPAVPTTVAPAAGDQPAGDAPAVVAPATTQASADGGDSSAGQGGDAPKGDAHAHRAVDGARAALAGVSTDRPADAAPALAATAPAPTEAATEVAPAAAPGSSAPTAAASPASDAPAPTAPVAAPAPNAAPRGFVAPNPVPVAHAPAALADLVHVAHGRGAGHARLVLHPDSLGGVEVHIRQTSEGIRATVHVEHADALAVLQNGLGDLRRGLEARGVTIDSIDLGLAPGNQDAEQQGNGAARGDGGLGSRNATPGVAGPAGSGDDSLTTHDAMTSRPAAGVLVDVMA